MNPDDRPGHDKFRRLEPDPKIPGWKCYLGGRCGFELHPGKRTLGCINVDKDDPAAMKKYDALDKMLKNDEGKNTLKVVP